MLFRTNFGPDKTYLYRGWKAFQVGIYTTDAAKEFVCFEHVMIEVNFEFFLKLIF